MKKIKMSFSVLAVILGVGIAVTGSSFRTLNDPNYGYDQSTSSWVSLPAAGEGTGSGQYRCTESTENCKVYASQNPNSHPESIDEDTLVQGDFSINP